MSSIKEKEQGTSNRSADSQNDNLRTVANGQVQQSDYPIPQSEQVATKTGINGQVQQSEQVATKTEGRVKTTLVALSKAKTNSKAPFSQQNANVFRNQNENDLGVFSCRNENGYQQYCIQFYDQTLKPTNNIVLWVGKDKPNGDMDIKLVFNDGKQVFEFTKWQRNFNTFHHLLSGSIERSNGDVIEIATPINEFYNCFEVYKNTDLNGAKYIKPVEDSAMLAKIIALINQLS